MQDDAARCISSREVTREARAEATSNVSLWPNSRDLPLARTAHALQHCQQYVREVVNFLSVNLSRPRGAPWGLMGIERFEQASEQSDSNLNQRVPNAYRAK